MSEQQEHDNTWLKPYLEAIQREGMVKKAYSDALFAMVYETIAESSEDPPEYPGAAKIRQTMYIAKLARSVGDDLFLTDKGNEFLAQE